MPRSPAQLPASSRATPRANGSARRVTYVLRVEGTNDLLEWSTQRRYGITEGERLALSGLVKAHTTRDATRVTVLRDCFNPLRTT